ncbi:hypothetical protein [Bacillus bombysepticus]|uniref:hypothetical protein n=1 Tax=Bacillus bombysepticus TaxID=658666 RepID=UPI00301762CA
MYKSLQTIIKKELNKKKEVEKQLSELNMKKGEIEDRMQCDIENERAMIEMFVKHGTMGVLRSQHERIADETELEKIGAIIRQRHKEFLMLKQKIEALEEEELKRKKEFEMAIQLQKDREIEELATIRRIRMKKGGI